MVESQYIDSKGKCRIYSKDGVYICTNPIHPFKAKLLNISDIKRVPLEKVVEYVVKYKLKFFEQKGSIENGIEGVWLEGGEYIFIDPKKGKFIEKLTFTDKLPPIVLNDKSIMKESIELKKIAHYLKEYALHYYSRNGKIEFVIDETHKYDIENMKGLYDKTKLFRDEKLVVTSNELAKRINNYVLNQLFLDTKKIMSMKFTDKIKEFYTELWSFSPRQTEIVCDNINAIKHNNNILETNERVLNILDFEDKQPYQFFSDNISDKIVLIQNVDKVNSLETSQVLGYHWLSRWNTGYNTDVDIEKFESVDEIVSNEILAIDSESYNKNTLLEIYRDL